MEVVAKTLHLRGNNPKVFGNNRQTFGIFAVLFEQCALYRFKKMMIGAGQPFAFFRSRSAEGDRPIRFKTTEVIDTNIVDEFQTCVNTVNPPAVFISFHCIPIIERVPPQLSRCAKIVWRYSGNRCRYAVFIQLEKFLICPYIRRIRGYENRDISNNRNTFFIRIVPKPRPLFKKEKLNSLIAVNLVPMFLRPTF